MTLFAKLRESVALFICPELRAKPQRAGCNGTAKPLERAALDAAYAARTPEERGFISAEEAQAHDRARKEWIEAEKSRLKELGEGVGEVPRPPQWTGWRVRPVQMEFWRDRAFRLHDRLQFSRAALDAPWRRTRLYP